METGFTVAFVLIAVILIMSGVISYGNFVVIMLIGAIVLPVLLVTYALLSGFFEDLNFEKRERQRLAKVKATKERKLQTAITEFPTLMESIYEDFIAIDNADNDLIASFYKKIDKICGYCAALKFSQIENKDRLKEILIYSRLNVLSFYEKNSLKGSDKLAKKITTTIKKLK